MPSAAIIRPRKRPRLGEHPTPWPSSSSPLAPLPLDLLLEIAGLTDLVGAPVELPLLLFGSGPLGGDVGRQEPNRARCGHQQDMRTVKLKWFGGRSGVVLIGMPDRGDFCWLDIRTKEIIKSSGSTPDIDYLFPYEMDLSAWVPTSFHRTFSFVSFPSILNFDPCSLGYV
ncbi:hypothetical protein BAE44_0012634 [Dichanthelium oligosanthes]|uniref:Uncharacterized protein n=1 Tax=Dichanthelium oligosanthes TaxID=888268 RepID=A0A1E5VMJ4_9POAL|nr:hypothetical protein BAE44_0012634 [Dichanthelium oligosanthes]